MCVFLLIYFVVIFATTDCGNVIELIPHASKTTSSYIRLHLHTDFQNIQNVFINCYVEEGNAKKLKRRDLEVVENYGQNGNAKRSFKSDKKEDVQIYDDPETINLERNPDQKLEPDDAGDEELAIVKPDLAPRLRENVRNQEALKKEGVKIEAKQTSLSLIWKLKVDNYAAQNGISIIPMELVPIKDVNETISGTLNVQCNCNNTPSLSTTSSISYRLKSLPLRNITTNDLKRERFYPYPEYIDLAPCVCDLKEGSCDNNCCCDTKDCTELNLYSFNCPAKDDASKVVKQPTGHECTETSSNFLCIVFTNAPFIDYFYPIQRIITTFYTLEEMMLRKKGQFYVDPFPKSLHPYNTYVKGAPIKIRKDWQTMIWRLPSAAANDFCDEGSTVHYLEEDSFQCYNNLVPNKCKSKSSFTISSFVELVHSAENSTELSAKVLSEWSSDKFAPTTVTFFCIYDLELYKKKRMVYSTVEDVVNKRGSGVSKCGNLSSDATSLNESNVCLNSVMEAHFILHWDGPTITQIDSIIFLADVTVCDEQTEFDCAEETILQRFSVAFRHHRSSEKALKLPTQINSPTISLPFWLPDAEETCRESKINVKAGQSLVISCWLDVQEKYRINCTTFKKFLCQSQKHLFSHTGDYLSLQNDSACHMSQNSTTPCEAFPTHVLTEVLYVDQAIRSIPHQFQILGLNISYISVPCLPDIGLIIDHNETWAQPKSRPNEEIKEFCRPVKRILLTCSIQAIIAAKPARTPVKKYWTSKFPSKCDWFICWEELFYPLSRQKQDDESLEYPVLILILFIGVGVVIIVMMA